MLYARMIGKLFIKHLEYTKGLQSHHTSALRN